MINRTAYPAGVTLAAALLAVCVGATPVSAGPNTIRFRLSTTGIDSDARGAVEYDATPGAERFRLKVVDLPAGSYVLLLNGSSAGTLAVTGSGGSTRGRLTLATADASLGFNPFGARFGISNGSSLFLDGMFPDSLASALQEDVMNLDLVSSGTPANATGRVEMQQKEGRTTLKVVLQKMAKGSYEFRLDDVLLGFVDVDGQGGGALKFSTQPNDAGFDGDSYLPLTFDPSGKTITIVSAGQSLFSGTFPGTSGGCGFGCTYDPMGSAPAVIR